MILPSFATTLIILLIVLDRTSSMSNLCKFENNVTYCADEYSQPFDNKQIKDTISIVSYNIDKNGYGNDSRTEQGLNNIIDLFRQKVIEVPDILLLQEVARDCRHDNQNLNGAKLIADSLGMNYYYSVEYVYDNYENQTGVGQCTNGNAILSKFKMYNMSNQVFRKQCCDETIRKGHRGLQLAHIEYQNSQNQTFKVQVMNTHLESGQSDLESILQGYETRVSQAQEVIEISKKTLNVADSYDNYVYDRIQQIIQTASISMLGHLRIATTVWKQSSGILDFVNKIYHLIVSYLGLPNRPLESTKQQQRIQTSKNDNVDVQFFGGDLNSPLYIFDLTYNALRLDRFRDSQKGISYSERNTCPYDVLSKYFLHIFDYIFYKTSEHVQMEITDKYVCQQCKGASDHNPIGIEVKLKQRS